MYFSRLVGRVEADNQKWAIQEEVRVELYGNLEARSVPTTTRPSPRMLHGREKGLTLVSLTGNLSNRRVSDGMHGGVGGRGLVTPSYPNVYLLSRCQGRVVFFLAINL